MNREVVVVAQRERLFVGVREQDSAVDGRRVRERVRCPAVDGRRVRERVRCPGRRWSACT